MRNVQLIELRTNNGWSGPELARRARISPKTVKAAEDGFRPSARIQLAIASQFGLEPTDLWPVRSKVAQ